MFSLTTGTGDILQLPAQTIRQVLRRYLCVWGDHAQAQLFSKNQHFFHKERAHLQKLIMQYDLLPDSFFQLFSVHLL